MNIQSPTSALNKGKIETIIYFYENNLLHPDLYIAHHKNNTIKELASKLGIGESQINYWVNEYFQIK